jgi:hypothetical protein
MPLAMPLNSGTNTALAAEVMHLPPGRGERIRLRRFAKTCSDRVPVDVGAPDLIVFCVADAMVGETSLPDVKRRGETVREASLDKPDGTFESDRLRSNQKVDVVGHDDERMELIVTFGPVVLEGCDEEFSVGRNLEKTASVVGCGGDEESAGA